MASGCSTDHRGLLRRFIQKMNHSSFCCLESGWSCACLGITRGRACASCGCCTLPCSPCPRNDCSACSPGHHHGCALLPILAALLCPSTAALLYLWPSLYFSVLLVLLHSSIFPISLILKLLNYEYMCMSVCEFVMYRCLWRPEKWLYLLELQVWATWCDCWKLNPVVKRPSLQLP